jgi:hypothetical protein
VKHRKLYKAKMLKVKPKWIKIPAGVKFITLKYKPKLNKLKIKIGKTEYECAGYKSTNSALAH